jgi:hypothetical protein
MLWRVVVVGFALLAGGGVANAAQGSTAGGGAMTGAAVGTPGEAPTIIGNATSRGAVPQRGSGQERATDPRASSGYAERTCWREHGRRLCEYR